MQGAMCVRATHLVFMVAPDRRGLLGSGQPRLENGRWVTTFPKARYLFSKKEYTYWSEVHQKTPLDNISESVLPVIEANRAELVTSDHELNDHIRLTPTPGHTPDHFAASAGPRGDQRGFTGSLIRSP